MLPVLANLGRYFSVTVTRQVDQKAVPLPQSKKIQMLCAPGVLLTNANRPLLASALMALDLPALDRPEKAISTPFSGGRLRKSLTVV